jgi:acetyl esterase/lipase
MNAEQRAQAIAALGRPITPAMLQGTIALFAATALRPEPAFCKVRRDIVYGADARHRLDVFSPVTAAAKCPVVIYVHGGGFVGGDKGAPEAPFYNNIGSWAARAGFVGITMTYRLAPAAAWPAGSDDVGAVVAWVRAHADELGADAAAIFVMGQSAGAAHVAGFLANEAAGKSPQVAGAIMLSGLYDLTRLEHSPMENAYYGRDESRFSERSPLRALVNTEVPCVYGISEFDPDSFQQQAGHVIAATLALRRQLPRMLYLLGHNHLSPTLEIGSAGDTVGPQLEFFVRRASRHEQAPG